MPFTEREYTATRARHNSIAPQPELARTFGYNTNTRQDVRPTRREGGTRELDQAAVCAFVQHHRSDRHRRGQDATADGTTQSLLHDRGSADARADEAHQSTRASETLSEAAKDTASQRQVRSQKK